MNSPGTFLTAEWRYLAMLNYEVDPALLNKFVPKGTELDRWNGKLFASLVGFRFLNTKVFGIGIPLHRDFDEVNLRFYVRRVVEGEVRRGVVFVKEIVPRWAIATVARVVYNENYVALPMWHSLKPHLLKPHRVEPQADAALDGVKADGAKLGGMDAEYGWRTARGKNKISVTTVGDPKPLDEGSEEQFITEHYWGYAVQRDGGTVEYRVEHPSWKVWRAANAAFEGDVEELYGRELAEAVKGRPASAFLAEGSEVTVRKGGRI